MTEQIPNAERAKMKNGLYDYCVSTIVDSNRLKDFLFKASGNFTEHRFWKTAERLLGKARKQDKGMAVILSDAAYNCEHLLIWGLIRKIDIQGERTEVQINAVQKIPGYHRRQELTLRSKHRTIRPNYIRPYAICETPPFLK
jgi:hypothetical protein